MNRGGLGGILLLFAVLAVACVALVVVSDEAEATIVGEPLPSWGSSWNIFQDTVAKDEIIRLDGDIHVISPYTLSLDGCIVIFNGTYDGDNGIYVDWGSLLYMNDTSTRRTQVRVNASSSNWDFFVYGEAYIKNSDMHNLYNGLRNYGYLWMEGSTVDSTRYGISSFSDFHCGNSTIRSTVIESLGYTEVWGIYATNCDASLHNLKIYIDGDMNFTYNTSSYYHDALVMGIYAYNVNMGQLMPSQGKTFSINISSNVDVHNYYDTSGTVTIYMYFYTYALYLVGNTKCSKISGLDIDIHESFYGAPYNTTGQGRVYFRQYQEYIYSSIGSDGKAPIEISQMDFENMPATFRTGGNTTNAYEYVYNTLMYFNDNEDARDADDTTAFHHLNFRNLRVEVIIRFPPAAEVEVRDCVFENVAAQILMHFYRPSEDYVVHFNTFRDLSNIQSGARLFYIQEPSAEGEISNNTFSYVWTTQLMYLYRLGDRIYIQGNSFRDSGQPDTSSDPFIYGYDTKDKVTFNSNTFQDMDVYQLIYLNGIDDKWKIENNDFDGVSARARMLHVYYNYGEVEFILNTVTGCSGNLFYIENNREKISFEENTIQDNDLGTDYLFYTYYTYGDMKVTDNEFTRNTADGALFYLQGITYWTTAAILDFERNTFKENTVSAAINGGLVVLRGTRYKADVQRNYFHDNVGNCINFYRPYQYYNSNYDYDFTVDGNEFLRNDGTCALFVDFTTYNIIVKKNTGTGNTGPLMRHVITDHYVYFYETPDSRGEVRGPRTIRVDSNSYNGNLGGGIDIKAQWVDVWTHYTYSPQTITILNNEFKNTGGDYAIKLVDFGIFPVMLNNDFTGSTYGIFLQAIDYPAVFERMHLDFDEESYDGGGANGMTAWALTNVDATFTDCVFTNYQAALYAKDCTIYVYWSAIPEASGKTEGRGYIYVYNHLELLVTWADETGADSMMPMVGGTVAFRGANGRYYGAMQTDENGTVGPMLVMPWSSVEGKMDAWSPYDATVMSGGLTARHTVNAIGELVGEDAVHLTILDTAVPEIIVNSPSEGETNNKVDLPVEGFLFERGSMVYTFTGRVDDGEPIPIEPMQQWSTTFMGLTQGDHTLTFEVYDTSGNHASATVDFSIDAAPPRLEISSPADGDVTRNNLIDIIGTFDDDVSEMDEITIRVNGDKKDATSGSINLPFTLTEGVNAIVVDATDAAGNSVSIRLRVTLDTFAPTLYVYDPLDGLVVADEMLTIDGLSEAGTVVDIELVDPDDSTTIRTEKATARSDGTFSAEILLEEGMQNIVVTAKDSADNVRTITREVTLDTQPPTLTIDNPTDTSEPFNTPTIELVGHIDDPDPSSIKVYIKGILVEHSGVFSKDIPLEEGVNVIDVRAVDPVGNYMERRIELVRDTIKPVLTVDTPSKVLTREAILEVEGTVDDMDVTVTIGSDTVNVDEDLLRFSKEVDLSQETSPLVITAVDEAGNSVTYAIEFVYDATAPTIGLDNVPDTMDTLMLYLNGTVDDDTATITWVTVDGIDYPVVGGKFSIILELSTGDEGKNEFVIEVSDDAGNTAQRTVSTTYVPVEDTGGTEEEDEGIASETLSLWGWIFLIAALTLIATAYVFSRRGVRA